ncbi:broad-complex core protein isoforms 1/2/3/4/5 isoform X2 [Microplitis demolitor]|uniref:broad-complex core protein isoforms 1/2/3/4/5 isoform X2 n=1 Tax=Microplitis demolitor TaxID=69319 RepID=UPI0004CCF3F2|nr:broad-complex core protein isoforms 1/2/3/4/5 isoform X2 [Microplitis demolitor]
MAASSSSSNSEQQYSLRWNDFHSSILSSFRHLRDEEDFVDVTLACDSNSFTAHKVVLSACSPYFRRLLKANPCQHPIVILRDVASSDMESLLRFMYHGEVHVGQEQLAAFLKTAQMLQVRGLADVKSGTAGAKIPSGSDVRDHTESPVTSRNTWHERGDPSDSGLSPPPEKRSKSYSPPVGNHLEQLKGGAADLQESLLGQALEGGPTIHTPNNDIKAQSTGEDSNSGSDNDEDMSNNDSILNSVKAEPNDILNDSMEHHRSTFPAALLGLQGLMPGPSGIHAANQDPNYGRWQPSREDCMDSSRGSSSWIPPGGAGTGAGADGGTGGGVAVSRSRRNQRTSLDSDNGIQLRQLRYNDKQQPQQQQQQQQQQLSSGQQPSNPMNNISLDSELSIIQHKLQNNLQSLQITTSTSKYLSTSDLSYQQQQQQQQHQQQQQQHQLMSSNNSTDLQGKPKCPECGKIYSNNSNLKQHIVNVHTVQTEYISCHVCQKQFKTKQYLQIHLLSMHGIRKRNRYPVYQGPDGTQALNSLLNSSSAQIHSPHQQYGNENG